MEFTLAPILEKYTNSMQMDVYIDQSETYCHVYGIKEEIKVVIFLTYISNELYTVVKDSFLP